jgi:hypothetical protein
MTAKDGGSRIKLNPQNKNRITTITKEVEEEMGKRKIVFSEEEDQKIWGRKNGGEFNLKEVSYYITDQDQEDPSAIVGKDLGQPLVAKNQNVQMASTSQPNSNLGKP